MQVTPSFLPLPTYSLRIQGSSRVNTYSRKAYTQLDLLADFGGFNDALFLIGAFIVTPYSAFMYSIEIMDSQLYRAPSRKLVQHKRDLAPLIRDLKGKRDVELSDDKLQLLLRYLRAGHKTIKTKVGRMIQIMLPCKSRETRVHKIR